METLKHTHIFIFDHFPWRLGETVNFNLLKDNVQSELKEAKCLAEIYYPKESESIREMVADRDKRISELEKRLLKADELIEKLSIAPDLAFDAGYLNTEKELIELIRKYETDKPKDK